MSHNHVILLTIDALRADHLSCHGYDRETTPALDRIAEENVQCRNTFSVSSHTREAIPGILTGRPPDEAINDDFVLTADTLATYLADTAYSTGAFHSNPYVSRAYGFGADFDRFDDDVYLGRSKVAALVQRALDKLRDRHYARAEQINERALDWFDAQEGPVFLWNHYMDAHGPYDPPQNYRGLFGDASTMDHDSQKVYKRAVVTDPESITDQERQEMLNRYDEEIRYVDDCIDDFLTSLRERGALDDALVIIAADHGDLFGEHGRYGHPRYLSDPLVHVPLIAFGPELSDASVEVPVSTLDIVPTILDFTNVHNDELPGISLMKLMTQPDEFSERHVFSSARGEDQNAHLRRFSVRTINERCFIDRDIETGEIHSLDVDGCGRGLEHALREYSEDHLLASQTAQVHRDGSSEEIERRLKALGYKE